MARRAAALAAVMLLCGSAPSRAEPGVADGDIPGRLRVPVLTALLKSIPNASSAELRSVHYVERFAVICGEFNSKDKAGVFAGFRAFIISVQPPSKMTVLFGPAATNDQTSWDRFKKETCPVGQGNSR